MYDEKLERNKRRHTGQLFYTLDKTREDRNCKSDRIMI